jgi:AbrB family looped-hinge helix DNA binding protein
MPEPLSAVVKVDKNGRITIPAEIRDLQDITDGDYIQIAVRKITKGE